MRCGARAPALLTPSAAARSRRYVASTTSSGGHMSASTASSPGTWRARRGGADARDTAASRPSTSRRTAPDVSSTPAAHEVVNAPSAPRAAAASSASSAAC
eukprot:223253-Chlamydomonas_euryale.AAC.1